MDISQYGRFVLAVPPWAQTLGGVAILLIAAVTANYVVKKIILGIFWRLLNRTQFKVDVDGLRPVVRRLANIVPALIIARGIEAIPHVPNGLIVVTHNVAEAFIVLTIALAISAALTLGNEIYQRHPISANRPIKGYIQVLKIVLYAGAAVLMVAALMAQSPLLLLSGLGAMAAVLLLVFKDTILSLVASVQLTSNDMLRVGDWIEMPNANADGDVIDIALHTVKVQNFDKTITTIPTYKLITDSYKNWRGMSESGGRRIKRALHLDQNSIRFLTKAEEQKLRRFALLMPYLTAKEKELETWNSPLRNSGTDPVNSRRLTNVGTFRAYTLAYLRDHPRTAKHMTLLVRQLQPTSAGLPLEIYCFTDTVVWAEYESIQADIFDHLLAILPEFGLRLFQQPSGLDLRDMAVSGTTAE